MGIQYTLRAGIVGQHEATAGLAISWRYDQDGKDQNGLLAPTNSRGIRKEHLGAEPRAKGRMYSALQAMGMAGSDFGPISFQWFTGKYRAFMEMTVGWVWGNRHDSTNSFKNQDLIENMSSLNSSLDIA